MKNGRNKIKIAKILMTLMLLGGVFGLSLPYVNVLRQNQQFSGIDLISSDAISFDVITLGGGNNATITTNQIAGTILLLGLLSLFFLTWLNQENKRVKIATIICSILCIFNTILIFGFVQSDNDRIEIKFGAGIIVTIFFLSCYLVYASTNDKTPLFEKNTYIILILLGVCLVYPYINTLALALDCSGESISMMPKQFTLQNFKFVVFNSKYINGVLITISRTILGTVASLACTLIFSYGLSKSRLIGQKFYMKLCVMTMYFSGGLIPCFLILEKLGLVNNYMVYIIPNLINVYNVILVVNYFKGIPEALEESAKIDGASDFKVFVKIMIPVSAPIVAVITLFNAVFQWNSWYDAYLYMMGRPELKPLQNVLIDIVAESQIDKFLVNLPIAIKEQLTAAPIGKSVVAAAIIVTIGPIILIYPLLQKYFVKGMMLGSVKE